MACGPPVGAGGCEVTAASRAQRRSVDIAGFGHKNPIPAACRLGPLMVSSMVVPYDPGTMDVPDDPRAQVDNLFRYVAAILQEGGATWDDVVRMTFYLPDLKDRPHINELWTATFPDPDRRPARIAHQVDSALGIRCEFLAHVSGPEGEVPC